MQYAPVWHKTKKYNIEVADPPAANPRAKIHRIILKETRLIEDLCPSIEHYNILFQP